MRCPVCNAMAGQGECAECRALAGEMHANAEALHALRYDELPHDGLPRETLLPLIVRISRRMSGYSWAAAAVAAVLLAAVAVAPRHPAPRPRAITNEPLKIKMLTPDPDLVIYWLIDSKGGE